MDIIETRVRRFVAMIIDWYLTNMLAYYLLFKGK